MRHVLLVVGVGVFALGFFAAAMVWQYSGGHSIGSSAHPLPQASSSESNQEALWPDGSLQNDIPLEFVLYYDFTCSHCKEFYTSTVYPLFQEYGDRVTFTIVPYASRSEGVSFEMAKGFWCGVEQKGQSIAMSIVAQASLDDDPQNIVSYIEADQDLFDACLKSQEAQEAVLALRSQARDRGVRGTPTFIIDGELHERNQPRKNVEMYILDALAR